MVTCWCAASRRDDGDIVKFAWQWECSVLTISDVSMSCALWLAILQSVRALSPPQLCCCCCCCCSCHSDKTQSVRLDGCSVSSQQSTSRRLFTTQTTATRSALDASSCTAVRWRSIFDLPFHIGLMVCLDRKLKICSARNKFWNADV